MSNYRNFSPQPEVKKVLTGKQLTSNVNATVLKEKVFEDSPLFISNCCEPTKKSLDGSTVFNTILKGVDYWSKNNQMEADKEAADKAAQIAAQKSEQERLKAIQDAERVKLIKAYALPVSVVAISLVAGLYIFLKYKK